MFCFFIHFRFLLSVRQSLVFHCNWTTLSGPMWTGKRWKAIFFVWSSPTFPFDWHPRLIVVFPVKHRCKDPIKPPLVPVSVWLMQFLLWLKVSWWQSRRETCINKFKCALPNWWIIILQFITLFDFSALNVIVVCCSNDIVSKDNKH